MCGNDLQTISKTILLYHVVHFLSLGSIGSFIVILSVKSEGQRTIRFRITIIKPILICFYPCKRGWLDLPRQQCIIDVKKWSSHLLGNLRDCLIHAPKKFQVSSKGFVPMTSAKLVQCSHQLSYEATQMWTNSSLSDTAQTTLMCSP